MNPWFSFLIALGLAFFCASSAVQKLPPHIGLVILGVVCFVVAAVMALPVLHL